MSAGHRHRIVRLVPAVASALALLIATRAPAAGSPADSVPMPPVSRFSYYYDALEQGALRPLTRALDPALLARKVSGRHREAANVDAQDRVRLPSTWWQPRLGFKPVSVEDMLTGPGPGTGPAPGPWTVTKAKTEGVSKGFQMKDSTGTTFAIKFDPIGCPELTTSADVVTSKLLWAAGYNVPDNSIAVFRREDLKISPKATVTIGGRKQPMTEAYIDGLLREVPRQADGSYRVVASRFLSGKPLGEWRYEGRRRGDAEDVIPHELRREIRGLWPIAAWINHADCSARNTLDMYVTDGGRSFVRHHLIDFSSCLGSASIEPQPQRTGHEYWVDYPTIGRSFVTLALPEYGWERSVDPGLPSVGFLDAATFDPGEWRPYLPNPAFDERTARDIRWGARIVAAFTDEHIRAAVACGHYSDPRAADYLVHVLEQRRDKLVARWLPGESRPADSLAAGTAVPPEDRPPAIDAPEGGRSEAEPARDPGFGARARQGAKNFFSDGWIVATSPLRLRGRGLVWAAAVLGAEAVIYANDQTILDATVRNREAPVFRTVLDVGGRVEPVGFMGRTNPIYAAALGAGYALDNQTLRTIPTEILESHLIAGGVRNLGKLVVGRRHPYEKVGPYQFDFAHGTSFPSGHTSVVFELATIASMNAHSLPVTIVGYSLASAVAFQRIESLNHWPSDVFIAAAYGTLVSRTVVRLNERRRSKGASGFSVFPEVSPDGGLIGARVVRRF